VCCGCLPWLIPSEGGQPQLTGVEVVAGEDFFLSFFSFSIIVQRRSKIVSQSDVGTNVSRYDTKTIEPITQSSVFNPLPPRDAVRKQKKIF